MPKRARLQPTTTTGSPAQRPPAPIAHRFANREDIRSSDPFSSSSSSPSSSPRSASASASTSTASATNRSSVYTHSSPSAIATMRARLARDRYVASNSSEHESDGHSDVDDFVPRYRTRSQTTHPSFPPLPITPPLMRLVRQSPTET